MKTFDSLTEQEILALAISLEEEDARIYEDFADGLQENYPEQAGKFRDHAPRRRRPPPPPARTLQSALRRPRPAHPAAGRARLRGPQTRLARPAARPEDRPENRRKHGSGNPPLLRSRRRRTTDAGIRQLLGDLAEEERNHAHTAERNRPDQTQRRRKVARRNGCSSCRSSNPASPASWTAPFPRWRRSSPPRLPPTTAADTFLVGLAASVGAGISMGFAEALSDDGSLTGRGHPWARGFVCGAHDRARAAWAIPCPI